MTAAIAWVDGRIFGPDQPAVSAFDHALLTGDGVFETLRVYDGEPFCPSRHLERLRRSAEGLGLVAPPDELVRSAVGRVLEASGLRDARLRITVTGGPSPLGSDRGGERPTVVVAIGPLTEWPPTASVVRVPWPRNERGAVAGLKTVSYAENVVALAYAKERGAGEAIFGNTRDELCEGTGSNIFVALGGRLLTPPLESGCLAGITRDLLIEAGVAAEETMPLSILDQADEVFITSSTREVQPVSHLDTVELPPAPGPMTSRAIEAFADIRSRGADL